MDFETWWTKEGQYIPPCDLLSEQTRTVYKDFARKVYEAATKDFDDEIGKAYAEGLDDGKTIIDAARK